LPTDESTNPRKRFWQLLCVTLKLPDTHRRANVAVKYIKKKTLALPDGIIAKEQLPQLALTSRKPKGVGMTSELDLNG
jgi:hypothetical protein